jgi:hypothetical protein
MFEEKLKLAEKKIFRHSKAAHSKPAAQEVGRVFPSGTIVFPLDPIDSPLL